MCTVSYIPGWEGEYLLHPSSWHASRPVRGAWSKMTSGEFAGKFAQRFGSDARLGYQGAGAFGAVSALATAIEAAGTLETQAVARALYSTRFDEFYGNFSFTSMGQCNMPFLMLQHTRAARAAEIVWPLSEVLPTTSIEFPMPTWAQRFCQNRGAGTSFASPGTGPAPALECSGHGTCNATGACVCAAGWSGASCDGTTSAGTGGVAPSCNATQMLSQQVSSMLTATPGWAYVMLGALALVLLLLILLLVLGCTARSKPPATPLLTNHGAASDVSVGKGEVSLNTVSPEHT